MPKGMPCIMVAVVKWLTRRIVAPLFEGSSPFSHPINFILKSLYGAILKRLKRTVC